MIDCPVCKGNLRPARMVCEGCHLQVEGEFALPRLVRLPLEMRQLAEQMLLCGGNLKDLAAEVGVSYPTLRRKVDDMIAALKELKAADEKRIEAILEGIDQGSIKADQGIRLIREIQGEL